MTVKKIKINEKGKLDNESNFAYLPVLEDKSDFYFRKSWKELTEETSKDRMERR